MPKFPSNASITNMQNFDLLQEVQNDIQISDALEYYKPFQRKMHFSNKDLGVFKSPKESAKEALATLMDAKLQKLGVPLFTKDDYIYPTAYPNIKNEHEFNYTELPDEKIPEYTEWQVYQSKFKRTGTRDSDILIKEMMINSQQLKAKLEARKDAEYEKQNFDCNNADDCGSCADDASCADDNCRYGRVYDDKFTRYYNSELFINLYELARDKETGLIDSKKILDPQTLFFIDAEGKQQRELNLPDYGVWQVDLVNLGIKFIPFSNCKGNPPPVTYEARNFETREMLTAQTLSYDNRLWPMTMDVTANDSDVNPDTLQLVDPRSNRPSLKFAVKDEGVWYVDNYNFVVFEPDANLKGNPTEIFYQAYTNQDEYAGTARIQIDFGPTPDSAPAVDSGTPKSTGAPTEPTGDIPLDSPIGIPSPVLSAQ